MRIVQIGSHLLINPSQIASIERDPHLTPPTVRVFMASGVAHTLFMDIDEARRTFFGDALQTETVRANGDHVTWVVK